MPVVSDHLRSLIDIKKKNQTKRVNSKNTVSLNDNYWKNVLGPSQVSTDTWNINHPITMSEIESTIRDMTNN